MKKEPFPGLEHIERRTERQVTIRPADHLVSLTGRRRHFIADATTSACGPFPVWPTSSGYVVASLRRGGKSTLSAHRGLSRLTTGEVVRL